MDSAFASFICCLVIVGFTCLPANGQSPDISSGAYIGCFRDIGQHGTFSPRVNATKREPSSCRDRCKNESSTYIGLWGGENCWCARNLYEGTTPNRTSASGLIEKLNDSQCNASCADNSSISCGGFYDGNDKAIFSVYSVCPKTKFGNKNCKQNCNCKDDNHCTVAGVCPDNECAPGWKLNVTKNRAMCNTDIDECEMECDSTQASNCHNCSSRSNERCSNTIGGYECICESGFHNASEGCKDIDECQDNRTHNCSHKCHNYEGGFNCSCREGYELEGFSNCTDIDECGKQTHKCNQTCNNTDGSYSCSCTQGFTLNADRLQCNDFDECLFNNSNCGHICNNTYGSYRCLCRNGYELENDNHACKDVDECKQNSSALCDQMCNNTDGSYFCSCRFGYALDKNKKKCNDVNECLNENGNCNQTCTNTNGSHFCSCFSGYQLMKNDNRTCKDVDECTNNKGNCSQQCINSAGSYECRCDKGYELQSDRHSCKDVDECSRNLSKCNQNCTNTIGGYNCSCFSGFKLKDEHICIDIDECEIERGRCQHYCNNTPGSFSCSCQPGFRSTNDSLNEETAYNCTDVDECSEGSSNCVHICKNTIGNYSCSCHSGFQLDDNRFSCSDINECETKNQSCFHVCHNHFGNYSCSCFSGHYLVGDYECKKDSTQTIIVLIIIILVIIIFIMVLVLLKMRKIFPFDKQRFTKLVGQKKGPETTYENGTGELKELKNTKPLLNVQQNQNLSPAADADQKKKKKMVRKTLVAVKDLKNYVEKIESGEGFEDEFRSVEMVSDFPYVEAQAQALKPKNRFKNILPYDHNRVILNEINDDPLTSYINASFIKGYKKHDKIIASHGPTPNTLNDFWRMIWQYDVSVIVMVTKCMEDGKCKCEQYWPLEGSMESGELTIAMDSVEKWPDYVISRLKVSKENSTRLVVHLLFTDWPDHGVPDHATSLISFRRAARSVIVEDRHFLVHCSAGVGRTGTFLAIDYLLQQAEAEGSIDVYGYLQGLRDQRMHAVQTPDQYEFIHRALLETLTLGRTTAPCSAFSDHRNYLQKSNPLTEKSYFQTQFDMLQEMHPPLSRDSTSVALDKNNISRNRNDKILPGDRHRVYVTESSEGSDYINAVFVSSYRRKDSFISTELPLPDTIKQFWQMTLSFRCKLIVFLDTTDTSKDLNECLLIPQKKKLSINGHKFWTSLSEPRKISEYCDSHSVAVSLPLDDEDEIYANAEEIPAFKILILHFRLSSEATTASLLPQIHEQIKSSSEKIKDNGPIVIVSRDGVYPSGPLIAVSNLLEMALSQNEVDVFSAVHCIKNTQPLFVSSVEEFQTIFDAVSQVESDFATYANY